MVKVRELKAKYAAEKLVKDMKKDQLEDEMIADLAGLQIDQNPVYDEYGHTDDKYIGTREAWEIYDKLSSGNFSICRKCGIIGKRGDGDVSTICENCAF